MTFGSSSLAFTLSVSSVGCYQGGKNENKNPFPCNSLVKVGTEIEKKLFGPVQLLWNAVKAKRRREALKMERKGQLSWRDQKQKWSNIWQRLQAKSSYQDDFLWLSDNILIVRLFRKIIVWFLEGMFLGLNPNSKYTK